jgi:ketosteroid isomerase-like protein
MKGALMQSKSKVLSLALLAMMAVPCLADSPDANAGERLLVEEATAEFYKSLNAMFTGDVAPMLETWSQADDVTYMGPAGGYQVGWEQVRAVWEAQAALNLGGKVLPEDVHVTVGQDLAVVQCREVGDNLDAEGQPLQVSIRATNVFRKENGEWKMIGHHTDLLPFLAKPAEQKSSQEISGDETPADEKQAEQISIDENPADETLTDENPAADSQE